MTPKKFSSIVWPLPLLFTRTCSSPCSDLVDEVRRLIAPEASRHATPLACLRRCQEPVYFIRCEMGFKRAEQRALGSPQLPLFPDLVSKPEARLRVNEVAGTAAAQIGGVRFHQKMQVPTSSLIAEAFHDPLVAAGSARGPLDRWQTYSGGPIGSGEVEIEAIRFEDEVWALIRLDAARSTDARSSRGAMF